MADKPLSGMLSGASAASLDAFLSMLMHRSEPSTDTFAALLADGCSPDLIQQALFERRNHALADKDLSAAQQRELIGHFDHFSLLLLQALAGQWQSRVSGLESRLSVAGSELKMASTLSRWSREGEVVLYNYFREVPITARVAVYHVREGGLAVERTADLVRVVAAGQHGRFAHIRLPELHSCLRLEVEGQLGRRVQFRFAGVFQTAQERRRHIRVLSEDAVRVSLTRVSGEPVQATVRDICQSGLGLSMQQELLAEPGEHFDFKLKLHSGELQGVCVLRWLHSSKGQAQFGVALEITPAVQRKLQLEVANRQKRTINALRMLGVPDSLI